MTIEKNEADSGASASNAVLCAKCKGAGWLWWNELDQYTGPAADVHDCYSDDTQYTCDACEGTGKAHNAKVSEGENGK